MKYLKYIIPSFVLLLIDIVWINFVFLKSYKEMIFKIQNKPLKLNPYYGFASYICALLLLNFIIIKNDLTLLEAFVLGFSAWGIYDFTIAALISDWKFNLVIADVLWGGILMMSMKYLSDLIKNKYN